MKLTFSLLFSFLFFAASAQQNSPMVADESATDASFMKFKAQLQKAVEMRDTTLLMPLLADSVQESANNPCQYCPKKFFVEMVCVSNDPYFWQQTELLLKYGFKKGDEDNPSYMANKVKAKEYFAAPSFVEYGVRLDTVLVLEKEVKIYLAPFKDSQVIGTVSYGKVATHNTMGEEYYDYFIYNQDEKTSWVCIQLPGGKIGYILSEKTSADLYKEMTVAKINGKWKIISFYHSPGC